MFDEWAGSGATPGMAAGAGSACRPGEPVARPGGAAHPDSAGGACLVDRLVVLRAEAARREAEMLALMAEFVQTRRREDAGPGERFSEGFAVDELALALVTTRHRSVSSCIWRRRWVGSSRRPERCWGPGGSMAIRRG